MHINWFNRKTSGPAPAGAGNTHSNTNGYIHPHTISRSGLSPEDQSKFITYGQGPLVKPSCDNILQAIHRQIRQNPQAIAAVHKGREVTYEALNRQACYLMSELLKAGVMPGDHVGLFVERSIPMLVGLLAILKAGAAYVPQDIRISPPETQKSVIQRAGIQVILTLSHLADNIPATDPQTVIIMDDILKKNPAHLYPVRMNEVAIQPDDHCFILFTSGTTGVPNGVQVTHRNVCNILLTAPGHLGIRPGIKVSQLLNIAFDMAAWEILGCLSNGGTLIIREKDFTAAASQCDVIIATPGILARIDPASCQQIKTVIVAGEPCPQALAERWAAQCRFINSCGPTETTIINTAHEYQPGCDVLPVGKPTPNNTVYVLDPDMQPCAIGEVGELWAGGAGVSAGYINNPSLTEARYWPDPFIADGSMMFRTRDLGRWNENGELEHLGRTDDQVKVKGFRVELDAISAVAESVRGCLQAVTLKVSGERLVTFVRPAGADTQQCLQAISERLPYYCVPSDVVALAEFPLTDRGKTDKRYLIRLAEAGESASEGAYVSENISENPCRMPEMTGREMATAESVSAGHLQPVKGVGSL